jgi:hypothetical protein
MKQNFKFSHCIGSKSLNTQEPRKSLKKNPPMDSISSRNLHHHFSMRWLDVLFPATILRVPSIGSVESRLKYFYNSKAMQFSAPT